MRMGGRLWDAVHMRPRGCRKGGDEVGNGGGVVSAGDGGKGEGGGCGLAELTGVRSGGWAGGDGGRTRAGGGSRGVLCVRSQSCNGGVSSREGLEGEGGANAACLTCMGDASSGSGGGE